ncbi:uncharacterized protein LOC123715055 [Pieris brassicae]|uniref:uncharacterized protein LOC123715055 n=1 Tax=Pieris brassicae TaxID=7116 RepID=UPI001E65E66F|nr:uncharacterized protein LOC123715055 [Pieris brassicae]
MAIIVVIYILSSFFCEARVFCEDSYASPWTPFGYACPVLCATVVNAIKRLKIMDYKKTIFQDLSIEPMSDINDVVYNIARSKQTKNDKSNSHKFKFRKQNGYNKKSYKSDELKRGIYYNKHFDIDKIDKSKQLKKHIKENYINNKGLQHNSNDYYKVDEIRNFVDKMASLLEMADRNMTALKAEYNNSSVSRRFHLDNTFVNIMTNVLNKYVSSSFKFTQEMTGVILNKLFFSSNAQKRFYDVGKLLKYLRKTVHIKNNVNNYVITLRPHNCMTISVPGCFCKQGYVEQSGQCVEPAKCLHDRSLLEYLDRINIL